MQTLKLLFFVFLSLPKSVTSYSSRFQSALLLNLPRLFKILSIYHSKLIYRNLVRGCTYSGCYHGEIYRVYGNHDGCSYRSILLLLGTLHGIKLSLCQLQRIVHQMGLCRRARLLILYLSRFFAVIRKLPYTCIIALHVLLS